MRFFTAMLALGLTAACASQNKSPVQETKAPVKEEKSASKAMAEGTGTTTSSTTKVTCSTKNDVRVLELRTKGKGCELAYTKNAQEGIVASSLSGSAHCESTLNKIRDRLKGAGFECK